MSAIPVDILYELRHMGSAEIRIMMSLAFLGPGWISAKALIEATRIPAGTVRPFLRRYSDQGLVDYDVGTHLYRSTFPASDIICYLFEKIEGRVPRVRRKNGNESSG